MDNYEIPEIVGSKDLREVFAAKPVVRGTFFINAVEVVPFAAASVASVLDQINRYAAKTFVDASVDQNYHLVLEARSPAPILIRVGRLLDPRASQDERNTVLVDLGLPETQPGLAATAVVHGVAPGPTPEERRRLRQERGVASGAIPPAALLVNRLALDPPAEDHLARLSWEQQVLAEAASYFKGPTPDWVKEIAEMTYPGHGSEQKQEATPLLPQQPAPPAQLVLGDEEKPKPRLPEIGWGGDIENRGPVGFPS